jgi:hypothetical protein
MSIWANYIDHLPVSCGITELGRFRDHDDSGFLSCGEEIKNLALSKMGAGWAIASFTDSVSLEDTYYKAYLELKKKFKIIYQSPVRKNRRTGNKFFFCVYDTTQKGQS